MKIAFILILLLGYIYSNAQKQTIAPPSNAKDQLIDEKLNNIKKDVDRVENEIDRLQANTEIENARIKAEVETKLEANKADTKEVINLYVFFISTSILGLGFVIGFFGKKAIRKRVEELIRETAQRHIEKKIVDTLKGRITNQLIEETIKSKSEEEINKIIAELENKGNDAISQIKSKGDEVIKSMFATPPKIQVKFGKHKLTDVEIEKQRNSVLADEFFNLAFNSSDPRIQIELYKNVLKLEPDNFAALNNMAACHNNLNETNESLIALEKAIKLNPEFYQAYTNRAQAYNLRDELDKAILDITKAIELEPMFEYSYAVKGNILTKQHKFDQAEESLNAAIKIKPDSAEAHYNRAFFYEETKEFIKSEEDYLMAESLGFANKAMLYNNMAVLYRRIRQFDKALDFIEKARSFNPNFPNIDGTLALIYADKGDESKFYESLKVALEKGCQAWNYLSDPGFDKYRNSEKLKMLMEPYRKKYFA